MLNIKCFTDDNTRENFFKKSGSLRFNCEKIDAQSEEEIFNDEEDIVVFAVQQLDAQDFVDMCGGSR
jgi:hypothetical protein